MTFQAPLRLLATLAPLTVLSMLSGCRSSFEGNYADPNKVEIVDDRWSDTDARLIGEKMIKSALSKAWLANYTAESKGQKPFVLVDDFENRTSEQIDTKAVFESVRNELINSGRVRFLDGAQRKKILDEYRYQNSGTTRKDQAKKAGNQYGADFFLVGAISSIVSQQGGYKTVTYQVEMRLTAIETSEIVWTEVEKVKKQFRRSGVGG
ncbi:MAG: penicillin-binding protein activator LpoB [Silvanigrellales bacterium]|jgi:uncharacterized protein (TIGR02722 family)|nr:penicillin-binding protein activator LpoB [Silvanigrellales bacterium]